MMTFEIIQYGNPVLRKKCRVIKKTDGSFMELAKKMLDTMREANGIGLAAPQIGLDIRMAVIDLSHDPKCVSFLEVNGLEVELKEIMPLVFINPTLELFGESKAHTEGCLSIPNINVKVRRPSQLKATLPQLDGSVLELETDGLLARALQHEVDHLNGVLITDRASSATKSRLRSKLKRLFAS